VEDLVVAAEGLVVTAEGLVVAVEGLVVAVEDLVVTAEGLVVAVEDLVATVVAGVVVVVVVEIEAVGEEDEVRGQVVLHNLKARRLLLIDCILSFISVKNPFASTHVVVATFNQTYKMCHHTVHGTGDSPHY
jgi:hypothetical protein